MDIYLVSLKSDEKRRQALENRFPNYYRKFNIIDAVDGRELKAKEYFKQSSHFVHFYSRMMSPAELGCSLSHCKVMEEFLASDKEVALVLEDDVVGTDDDIAEIEKVANSLEEQSIVICGCQDGSGISKYLYGQDTAIPGTYKLATFSHEYVVRTAAYIITKESAKAILNFQKDAIMLADNWGKFFVGTPINMFYFENLSHPLEMTDSHIEAERLIFRKKPESFIAKLFSKKIFSYVFKETRKLILGSYLKSKGYKSMVKKETNNPK